MAEGNRREKKTDRRSRGRADRPGFSRDRHDPEANAFRIRSELAPLEKAYSQKDFAKQKASLEEILKQLKPLRLRSIDQLDFNTSGRLITTLLRVGRQIAHGRVRKRAEAIRRHRKMLRKRLEREGY